MGILTLKPFGFSQFVDSTADYSCRQSVVTLEEGYNQVRIGLAHNLTSKPGFQIITSGTESNDFSSTTEKYLPVVGGSVIDEIDDGAKADGWHTNFFSGEKVGYFAGTGTLDISEYMFSDWTDTPSVLRDDGSSLPYPFLHIRLLPYPLNVTVTGGGTGHTLGDIIGLSGGLGQDLEVEVTAESGGIVSAVKITQPGSGHADLDAVTQSSGPGADLALTISEELYTSWDGDADVTRTPSTDNRNRTYVTGVRGVATAPYNDFFNPKPPITPTNQLLVPDDRTLSIIVQYRTTSSAETVTVMAIGDSLTEQNNQADEVIATWGWQGAYDASTPERPVSWMNAGFSSAIPQEYFDAGRALTELVTPEIMVWPASSPNPLGNNATPAAVAAQIVIANDLLDLQLAYNVANGIKTIVHTWAPNSNRFTVVDSDNLRKAFNVTIIANATSKGYVVADFANAAGDGATPELFVGEGGGSSYTTDGTHYSALFNDEQGAPLLTKAINEVLAGLGLTNQPYFNRQSQIDKATTVDLTVQKPKADTFAFTGLPTGLTDNSDGTVSGTPTVEGQVEVTATVDGSVSKFNWYVGRTFSQNGDLYQLYLDDLGLSGRRHSIDGLAAAHALLP